MSEASTAAYQKFVGQTVKLVETKHEYRGHNFSEFKVAEGDPTMQEIKDLRGEGRLRILTPGTVGTCDWNPSRINVHIDASGTVTRIDVG